MATDPRCDRCGAPALPKRIECADVAIRLRDAGDLAADRTIMATLCADHADPQLAANEAARDQRRRRLLGELDAAHAVGAGWTLATWPTVNNAGRDALDLASEWPLDHLQATLNLLGSPGAGKTGLARALVRHWIESRADDTFAFGWANVRRLLADLQRGIRDTDYRDPIPHLIGCDLLVLDDLGAERVSPTGGWSIDVVAQIIEGRYDASRLTIVTSNYGLTELGARLSTDSDPIAGQRIVSRLAHHALTIRLDRPDQRRRAA